MTLKDRAYEQIKAMIIDRELEPGEPLLETTLAEELHMSRTPIREAINELVKDGLVNNVPKFGNLVAAITAQDIIEIYDIRYALEKFALEKSFPYLDYDLLREYRKEVEGLEENFTWDVANRLNLEIHAVWIDRCGNQRIKKIIADIKPQIRRLSSTEKGDRTREDDFIEEHLRLIDLILENECDEAVEYLGEHIINIKESTLLMQQHNS